MRKRASLAWRKSIVGNGDFRAPIGKRGTLSTIKCRARKPLAAAEW
jgi:hypothetical protein